MHPEESNKVKLDEQEFVSKYGESIKDGSKVKDKSEDTLKILEEWLQQQCHLPKDVDVALLRQMLYRCNGSVERAKTRLEAFFCLRTEISEMFSNRNPFSKESQMALETMMWAPLPRTTPEGNVVYVFRLKDNDPSKYSFESILRVAHMEMDELLRNGGDRCVEVARPVEGLVYIFDLTGQTMAHIASMQISLIAKAFAYIHEGLPVKIREVHLISHSSLVDRMMLFLRPLVRRIDKLHVHSNNNINSLSKHIPMEILPEEYGGEEERLEILHRRTRAAVEGFRNWLSEEETKQRVSEETLTRWQKGLSWSLALGQGNCGSNYGVDGSFRKLCLD